MTFFDVVGLLSGLLAIFSFATGVTSIGQLRRAAARPDLAAGRGRAGAAVRGDDGPRRAVGGDEETGGGATERASRARLILWVSVPVFIISLALTLASGLGGSDSAGAQFVLLVEGAALLLLYATRMRRSLLWPRFLTLSMVILGASGLFMGVMSRGEEAEGLLAGIVIGAGVGLLGLAFPGTAERADPPRVGEPVQPSRTEQEREVLRVAREQRGEVSTAQVAVDTAMSLDEAQLVLGRLAERGFCERHVLAGGAVVYRFPDFRPR